MNSNLNKTFHTPVLLNETLKFLNVRPNGIYVDATVGGAGHAFEIAKSLKHGLLFCFDKDPDAIIFAQNKLKNFSCVKLIESSFSNIKQELNSNGTKQVDGILIDLGVSSFQIDEPSRGFSYIKDGPLDMRMNKSGKSAFNIVNEFKYDDLKHILKNFGEERFAGLIAKKIVLQRSKKPITTTLELAQIVTSAVPAKFKHNKNPCKKTFQAIRIFINDEINQLKTVLSFAANLLKPKGRLVVISFHSIEDRIVKQHFNSLTKHCSCPPSFPICVCNTKPQAIILTKKPIIASDLEISFNSRSKSAKLRAIEKI